MNSSRLHIVITGALTTERREEVDRVAQALGATVVDTQAASGEQAGDGKCLRSEQAAAAYEVKNALSVYDLSMDAPRILSNEERDTLVCGIAQERHNWEQDWVGDVVGHGYIGWHSHPDHLVIEDALVSNFCLQSISDTDEKLNLLRVMARPDVLSIVTACLIDLGPGDDTLDHLVRSLQSAVAPADGLKTGSAELAEVTALVETIIEQLEHAEDQILTRAANANPETPT